MKINGRHDSVSILKREISFGREANILFGVTAFAFLTAVGAYLRLPLPFTPVPVTLQVFFVLLCAATLGPVYGSVSQGLYLALGAAGLPMFSAGGVGFAHLLGPTGGYILGFIAAQSAVGLIMRRGKLAAAGPFRAASAMAAGIIVIYAFGVLHLKAVTGVGIGEAISLGAMPFIPADLAKGVVAAAIILKTKKRVSEIF